MYPALRKLIIVVFFTVFMIIFGYPACQRFMLGGVIIEQDQEYSEEIIPPAVRICPQNTNTKQGWKSSSRLVYILISLKKLKNVLKMIERWICVNRLSGQNL